MPSTEQQPGLGDAFGSPFGIAAAAMECIIDAAQRTVLFWDVMRQCGNQYREHMAEATPNVLDYEVELVIYYHEKSRQEVVAIVGVSCAKVKTRMFYARKKLATPLEAQGLTRAAA